jgi:hypothetical protein
MQQNTQTIETINAMLGENPYAWYGAREDMLKLAHNDILRKDYVHVGLVKLIASDKEGVPQVQVYGTLYRHPVFGEFLLAPVENGVGAYAFTRLAKQDQQDNYSQHS